MAWASVLFLASFSLAAGRSSEVPAPFVSSCGPGVRAFDGLLVQWEAIAGSDYYEVQLLTNATGEAFAIVSTGHTSALVQDVLPDRSYWVRLRAHRAMSPSLGPGTWGPFGQVMQCSVGRGPASAAEQLPKPAQEKTFWLEVLRESEYTIDVDYLGNHNSGSVLGDIAIATSTGSMQPSFFENFTMATLSMFCVEVLEVKVPNTMSTGGDERFADYLSCNYNPDHQAPQCECDNWIDRKIANQDPDPYCHDAYGKPCSYDFLSKCTCSCSDQSRQMSAKYTGMMPVFFSGPSQLGNWYSHPVEAECTEDEAVGSHRKDGSQCTWKRRPDARIFKGFELIEAGWNLTFGHDFKADSAQVLQNVQTFRKVEASRPLRPWKCGTQDTKALVIV